jgi:hypothetical protein
MSPGDMFARGVPAITIARSHAFVTGARLQ